MFSTDWREQVERGANLAALALGCLLCACSPKKPATVSADAVMRAATLRPADAHLASLYDNSCRVCHANPQANAPLTGDRDAWRPRLKKGRQALVSNVLTGFNGMPPGGQCAVCTRADIEGLIGFLSSEGTP